MLAHSFDEICFEHCSSDANQVRRAHQLARHSYISKSVVSWEGQPFKFILSYVISDVTPLDVWN
jgi:hypothetical protein